MPQRSSGSALVGSKIPVDALDHEIAQEMASAIGRLGRALEQALQTLVDFDAAYRHEAALGAQAYDARHKLTAKAARALWLFSVQREACGLRDSRQIMHDYRVPPDVLNQLGAFP